MPNKFLLYRHFKRVADVLCASVLLVTLSWCIVVLVVIASIDTKSFGVFKQIRIGHFKRKFSILKIKTFQSNSKISSIGAFLRRSKLDELPQLLNVLFGDMSFVEPRPDVPGFADELMGEEEIILSVRPGITGPATLYFRDEEALLVTQPNPERYNREVIWPKKVELNLKYVQDLSFTKDVYYLFKTFFKAMNSKIWLSAPHIGTTEEQHVKQAFSENWIAPMGPQLLEFESTINAYLEVPSFSTAVSSGTAAIHLALKLLNVTTGDEVMCQSFTFCATANPITYLGAIPVFIDSEPKTWNMCPVVLEAAIKSRIKKNKKPKAIIFVDLYGMPAKIDAILKVAAMFNIPVIEDAAEALGSSYKNRKCGTFGQFSIFSFNGNKIITTSGGGALVSRAKTQHDRALFYATQAKEPTLHYEHQHIGFNYRLSNVCAAIGLGQMEVLNKRVAQRQANHRFYQEFFADKENVTVFSAPNKDYQSNYWLSCILINKFAPFNPIDLINHLSDYSIEARPLWKPLHLQPVFKSNLYFGGSVCEDLFNRGVCLPSGSSLTENHRLRITEAISKFLKK